MSLFLIPVKWKQRGKPKQAGAHRSLPLAKCFVDALVPGFLRFLNQGQKQGRGVSFYFFWGGDDNLGPILHPSGEEHSSCWHIWDVFPGALLCAEHWGNTRVDFPLRGQDGMRLMPRQPPVPILTPAGKTPPAFPERTLPRDGKVWLCQKATKIHPKIIPSNWEGFFQLPWKCF